RVKTGDCIPSNSWRKWVPFGSRTYCPDRNLTTLNHLVRLPNGTHFLHEFDGMQSPVLTLCRNDTAPLEIHGGHAHRWTSGQVDGNFRSGTIDLGCLHSIDI